MDAYVVGGGNQKLVAMNRLINALFWGLYLIGLATSLIIEAIVKMAFLGAIALCSAWCWVKEKVKKVWR